MLSHLELNQGKNCQNSFKVDGSTWKQATSQPVAEPEVEANEETQLDSGYLVICWDDPVNLMDYVTHVFQKVFGWNLAKAEYHMLQVHRQGKSVLTKESFEKAEFYVHQLHQYRLHATLEKAE